MNKKPENTALSEVKNLFSSMTSMLAILASAFALFVGYKKFIEERPNLVVQIENIKLIGYVRPDTILYELEEIEQQYGLATGDKILKLKDSVENLNGSFLDSATIVRIIAMVYENIRFFQMPPPRPWDYSAVQYKNGVITWPDGATYNISKDDDAITILGPSADSASLQNLKRAAYSLYQPFEKSTREAIANRLRLIRTKLNSLADHPNHFLEVSLRVINKSTQPNMLMRTAKFAIVNAKKGDIKLDTIPLTFSNESVVNGFSESHMTLRSQISSRLKRGFNLNEIFSDHNDYTIALALNDVEDCRWQSQSEIEVDNGIAEVKD